MPELHAPARPTSPDGTPMPATNKDINLPQAITKLRSAQGLCELAARRYKPAARCFLQCHFFEDSEPYLEMVSAVNIAQYGTLCGLATFERAELERMILTNNQFKQFLELDPQLRELVHKFHSSQYAVCLKLLHEMRENLLLDKYIAPHVPSLYLLIRQRAICQFFSPYASVSLERMASAFTSSVQEIEEECMQLILDGQIAARIDSYNKILYARSTDVRAQAFEKALQVGADVQRRTHMLLLRAALVRNGIAVRPAGHRGDRFPAVDFPMDVPPPD